MLQGRPSRRSNPDQHAGHVERRCLPSAICSIVTDGVSALPAALEQAEKDRPRARRGDGGGERLFAVPRAERTAGQAPDLAEKIHRPPARRKDRKDAAERAIAELRTPPRRLASRAAGPGRVTSAVQRDGPRGGSPRYDPCLSAAAFHRLSRRIDSLRTRRSADRRGPRHLAVRRHRPLPGETERASAFAGSVPH